MKRSRVLLIVSTICFWSGLYVYVPILAPYSEHLGASLGMVGLIVSAYGFSQLLMRIPIGMWSDQRGKRKPFILSAFLASAGAALGLALAQGPVGVLAARALSGVAATMWVVITVLFASYYPADRAGYAMSLITFTTTISQLVSTLSGGLIAERWGWQGPFWVALVVAVIGFFLTLPLREGEVAPIGLKVGELLAVGRERGLLLVSSLAILFQFNSFVTIFGFVPNFAVTLGANKAQLGWLSLIAALPNALASLGTGSVFARRFTERQMVTVGFFLVALTTLAIPVSRSLWMLHLTQGLGGFGRGLIFPVLMALSIRTVPQERRATAMGFFQSIYALGMFAGPAISGVLADWIGLGGTFYVTGTLTLLGAWAAFAVLSPAVIQYGKVDSVAG